MLQTGLIANGAGGTAESSGDGEGAGWGAGTPGAVSPAPRSLGSGEDADFGGATAGFGAVSDDLGGAVLDGRITPDCFGFAE